MLIVGGRATHDRVLAAASLKHRTDRAGSASYLDVDRWLRIPAGARRISGRRSMSDPIQPGPTVARFYVASTEEFGQPDDDGLCSGKVTLNAVSRGDQNKQWASATPSGTLTMHINNGRAFEALRAVQRAGLDVDVVLTPVPAHRPDDGHPFRQSTMPAGSSYGGEGTCGDCGVKRVDTWSERGVAKVTHKADRDAGWTLDPATTS